MRDVRKKDNTLSLPTLSERAEDIFLICKTMLAALRMAHPFVRVASFEPEAFSFLQSQGGELNYQKLVRLIRNTAALCKAEIATVEDLKNYSESDGITQHLLESMADESFFPQQDAAVNQ